jgi:hypothetical protein
MRTGDFWISQDFDKISHGETTVWAALIIKKTSGSCQQEMVV